MKCCICSKEVDVEKSNLPPKWYGKYQNAKLLDVICAECIKKKENKQKWK